MASSNHKSVVVTSAVLFFWAIWVTLSSSSAYAASPSISPTPSPSMSSELDLAKEQYKFLHEEARHYEERVDRERTIFFTIIGIVGVLGMGGYFGTMNDIRKSAKKKLEDYIVEEGKGMQANARSWAKSVIDDEFGLNKSILILAPKAQKGDVSNLAVRLFKRRGFTNIKIQNPDTTKIEGADLIVYWYNDTLEDNLTKLITKLENEGRELPVIVYYRGQLTNTKFKQYMWGSFANSPMTLVSWVFTILTSFYSQEQK